MTAKASALMESFWGRMQVELFNRRKWKTRIELAAAIHDYIELWHNTRRRHSALGMLTPAEAEERWLRGEPLPRTTPSRTTVTAGPSGASRDPETLQTTNEQAA